MFAERVWCLRQLARTLAERHGVEAHVGDGQVKAPEFELLKQRFTAGEFPVLCLSQVGHEGHNLQTRFRTDPPGPAVGPDRPRAARRPRRPPRRRQGLGADLHPLHPRRRGRAHRLGPRRRAAPSTTRSSTASRASAPANRRSPPSSAQIAGQVADSKNDAGFAGTAARLRVAASVFGA